MKIAIPTNDGVTLSNHFGRSAGFMIFEIADGAIQTRELRRNQMVHAPGEHSHTAPHSGHSHGPLVDTLDGCSTVICGGIGRGAVDALRSGGIDVIMTGGPAVLEEIAHAYLAGTLAPPTGEACSCRH